MPLLSFDRGLTYPYDRALMFGERLPVHIDPIRFAETDRILEGIIPLSGMKRLADLLLENSGEVTVKLEFGVDSEGIRYLQGHITATLIMTCQRCLESLTHQVDNDFLIAFVGEGKSEDSIPEYYEPFLLDGDPVYLQDLIEDELILAVPLIPKHDNECVDYEMEELEPEQVEVSTPEENPFAVLSSLKK